MPRSDPGGGARTASERFHRIETLGSGGNGVVYRALDLTLGVEVALKYLTRAAGRDLYRFKREFRALAEVAHPNLVRLYELFVEDDQWSFSMELVQGLAMREHLRAHPGTLADTFAQLADGVSAIHALGKIHRDLKPTNVIVETGGRVVILDFGLVRGNDPDELDHTHEALAVGTPAFMSPEQALDQPLTAATDWYSVGAMLYEALTGRRPFEGTAMDVLRRRVHEDPPPPRALRPDVPERLDALCMALLARDPAARADGRAVLETFGSHPSAATLVLERKAAPAPFVGRGAELAAMRAALAEAVAGTCVFMPVIGVSGMGKSTLVRRFVDELDPVQVLVLEGRCHEREHVPYQGIESLVDAAATLLMSRPTAELETALPPDVATLARLFPSLLRVPAIAAPRLRRFDAADHAEVRRRAVGALGDLLGYLAGARTLVVVLDDLQWSDADGGLVLAELVRYFADTGALFVAASRSALAPPTRGDRDHRDATPTMQLGHATEPTGPLVTIREIELGPLPPGDVEALARAVAPAQTWAADHAAAIVRASGGVPFFVTELACHPRRDEDSDGSADFEHMVAHRLAQLPADARDLLTACAAAARPLPLEIAAVAAGGDPATALTVLRNERLLRTHRRGEQLLLEPYHDRIRAAVLVLLAPEARRAIHRKLAATMAGRPDTAATELVEHFHAAGDLGQAAHHAAIAARQAEDALAFHVAADLHRTALEAQTGAARQDTLRRLAACLANVGQLDDAIEVLGHVATDTTPAERRALDSLRIEYMLRRGDFARGMTEARALCANLGIRLPRGPRATIAQIVLRSAVQRLRGTAPRFRDDAAADPAAFERIDILWALNSGLVHVDPKFARLLQLIHLRAALDCGEPTRLARALSLEVPHVAQAGSAAGKRLERALAHARTAVEAVDRPDVLGLFHLCAGVGAAICGEWVEAERMCRSAEQLLRTHYRDMRWTLNLAQFYRLMTLWYLGRTDEIVRLLPGYLAEAEAVGDAHALAGLRGGRGNLYWLVVDRVDDARAMAALGMGGTAQGEFLLGDYFHLKALGEAALCGATPAEGLAVVEEATPRFERSLIRRIQMVRIEWASVRARTALGAAVGQSGRERAATLAVARTCVRRIAAEKAPWTAAPQALSEAALAQLAGDEAAVQPALERAIAAATARDMALHAAAARYRLGQVRGPSGRTEVAEATAWLRQRSVVNPAALVRVLAPGWPDHSAS